MKPMQTPVLKAMRPTIVCLSNYSEKRKYKDLLEKLPILEIEYSTPTNPNGTQLISVTMREHNGSYKIVIKSNIVEFYAHADSDEPYYVEETGKPISFWFDLENLSKLKYGCEFRLFMRRLGRLSLCDTIQKDIETLSEHNLAYDLVVAMANEISFCYIDYEKESIRKLIEVLLEIAEPYRLRRRPSIGRIEYPCGKIELIVGKQTLLCLQLNNRREIDTISWKTNKTSARSKPIWRTTYVGD